MRVIRLMYIIEIFWTTKNTGISNLLGGSDGKDSACQAGDLGFIPRSGRYLVKEWLPTPVFLPEESHGQRSLVGSTPWDCKESDTTEQNTLWLKPESTFQKIRLFYKYSHSSRVVL